MIASLRPQPNAGTIVEPEPAPWPLFLGYFEPLSAPDPLHPICTAPNLFFGMTSSFPSYSLTSLGQLLSKLLSHIAWSKKGPVRSMSTLHLCQEIRVLRQPVELTTHSGHSPRTQKTAAFLLELSDRRAAFVRVHQLVGRFEKTSGCRAIVRIKRKSDTR